VGEARDGEGAIALVARLRPDVVVMDVEMPHLDGIAATAALRQNLAPCAVVMLSLHDDAATRSRAHAAGVHAFVAKHAGDEALVAAIRQAAGRP
jgi:DNA-binding NarL/FixJ family response regulator